MFIPLIVLQTNQDTTVERIFFILYVEK